MLRRAAVVLVIALLGAGVVAQTRPAVPTGVQFVVPSGPPVIASLSVATGPVGTSVTVIGLNFGNPQGTSVLFFNGVAATIASWSDGVIVATVPTTTTGLVTVSRLGNTSNGLTFTVTSGGCSGSGPTICSTSGTLSQGSTLTVTGVNFTVNAVAAPFMYDDFASGTPNAKWSETYLNDPGGCGSISTTSPRTNFTRQIRYDFRGTCDGNMSHMTMTSATTSTKWLTSFYGRIDAAWTWPTTCTAGSTSLANVKLIRIWGPSDPGDESAIITWDSGTCIGTGMNWFAKGSNESGTSYDQTTSFTKGSWHQIEVVFTDSSTTSSTDGALKMWIDGVSVINASNVDFRDTSALKRMYDVGPWNSWGGGGSADNFWDETGVYINNGGFWRAEICPGSTFTTRGKCEMQIPSAWSDTSLSLTLKQGELGTFTGKFLYVFDSAGTVNASGFAL